MPFTLAYGASTDVGRRPAQQDEYLIVEGLFPGGPPCWLFAVLDGHGSEGGKVSAFVKKLLPEVLRKEKDSLLRDPVATLKRVYSEINQEVVENQAIDTYLSGTTAIVLLIFEGKLVVAHVGDSRGALVRNVNGEWIGEQLTIDHTCANEPERARVVAGGARVEQLLLENGREGPLRIFKGTLPYPGLVVTRAIGDEVAQRLGVLSEPEVKVLDLTPADRCVVIGTDGVWDTLTIPMVKDIVSKHTDPVLASRDVTAGSLIGMDREHLDDNTTNIVVYVNHH